MTTISLSKEVVNISEIEAIKNLERRKERISKEKERINEEALRRYKKLLKESKEESIVENLETAHEAAKKIEARIENIDDFDGLSLERIINGNDLFPISYLQSGFNAGNSICRIVHLDRAGRNIGYGTGFLISPSLLMTNNHVLDKKEAALYSVAEFNYQNDENNLLCQSASFRFDPNKLFITDKMLDFTIVAVQESTGNDRRLTDFGYLKLSPNLNIVEGEYVSIIQHPEGGLKAVTVRENRVQFLGKDFIHYVSDTERGSSGSPVFNDQWVVVALHHSGVRDPNDSTQWVANEGIRISSILEHLNELVASRGDEKEVEIRKGDGVKMSGKNLSKEHLELLKQIIISEEGKSSKEALGKQNVKNTDSFEAFGRAILEQIQNGSMKEEEKTGGSTGDMVLDTQITISTGTSGEQEGWFDDVVDKAGDVLSDAKDAVGDALDDVIKQGKKILPDKLDTKVCVTVFGKKICYDVNPF